MLSPELLDVQDYAITSGDFVGVEIEKNSETSFSVTYKFNVYLNLYLSLIKQFDEIELRVMEPNTSKISYFSDSNLTPAKVSQSAVNFVPRIKQQLVQEKNRYQIASSTVKLSQFLGDSVVAAIGSGRINEENYELFLPVIEYSKAVEEPVGEVQSLSLNPQELTRLAVSSFEESSFHPSEIFELKKKNPRSVLSPAAEEFYAALKSALTNTKVSSVESSKQTHQLCTIPVLIQSISESRLLELSSKSSLELQIIFYRRRVPKLKSSFTFRNSHEYESCCLRLRDLSVSVRPNSYQKGIDFVRVLNPNPFDVIYELRQNSLENRVFVLDTVSIGKLKARSSINLRAKFNFGGESDSRSYSVVAVRDLPILTNRANTMDTASVPQSRVVSLPSLKLEAFVQDSAGTAEIITRNVPDFVERAIVSRKEKGFSTELNIATITPNSVFSDETALPDGDYIYKLKFYSGGCQVLETIEMPFIRSSTAAESANVTFDASIAGISQTKLNYKDARITHTLNISEEIQTTVAESLQNEIQSLGLSDKFDEDRENNKSQVSITTRYKITRLDLETGQAETIPSLFSPGTHSLTFVGDPTHAYRYFVNLKIANTAGLSYLTVVNETDAASGKAYKLRFRKWRSYEVRRSLSLPSSKQILKNSLTDSVDVGGVGETKVVDVPFAVVLPSVQSLELEVDGINKRNYLTWEVSGDLTEVDHFMVLGTYANIERVLGTAIPSKFEGEARYRYVDTELQGLVGEVSYRIVLVMRGLKYTSPSSAVSFTRDSSVPTETIMQENQ